MSIERMGESPLTRDQGIIKRWMVFWEGNGFPPHLIQPQFLPQRSWVLGSVSSGICQLWANPTVWQRVQNFISSLVPARVGVSAESTKEKIKTIKDPEIPQPLEKQEGPLRPGYVPESTWWSSQSPEQVGWTDSLGPHHPCGQEDNRKMKKLPLGTSTWGLTMWQLQSSEDLTGTNWGPASKMTHSVADGRRPPLLTMQMSPQGCSSALQYGNLLLP